ncbi:MAG TPA: cytochrome c1 [Mariprofundaceae bacterium]|nr:cytochrome c1 [Mariprofundaceae bacterium]
MKRMLWSAPILGIVIACAPAAGFAAEGNVPLKHPNITMDQKTLREGLQVFVDVCMGCHSAKYVTYGDLMRYPEIALPRQQVDDLRGNKSLLDGLTTDLTPADAKVSYGKVPPDLSVITRSRQGADYVYSILTGFAHDPEGRIPDGHYNIYFPGNNIAMPDPLTWFQHDPADEKSIEEQARSVSSFLAFISEPHQLQRESLGRYVIAFLVLLTAVLWWLKREIWKDVQH